MSNNTPFDTKFELNNPFLNMQVDNDLFNQEHIKISNIKHTYKQILLANQFALNKIHRSFLNVFQDYLKQVSNIYLPHEMTKHPQYSKPSPAIFDKSDLIEFATGSIETCLGPDFNVRKNVKTPRIPNGELLLMDRVIELSAERNHFTPGSYIVTEYDIPRDGIWYLDDNAYPCIPTSVMMEMALQPCGFLSAYLGTSLIHPQQSYYFRNLDGQSLFVYEKDLRGKTIKNKARLVSSVDGGNTIIQKFFFELQCNEETIFHGTSTFGYFPLDSSGNKNASSKTNPAINQNSNPGKVISIEDCTEKAFEEKPHFKLALGHFDLLDSAIFYNDQGKYKKGLIRVRKKISDHQWFFKYHFYQDPVMPGSLGIEAAVRGLQIYAINNNLDKQFSNPRFGLINNHSMDWKYTGQITPENNEIRIDIHIVDVNHDPSWVSMTGEAEVFVDDVLIYTVKNTGVRILEGE